MGKFPLGDQEFELLRFIQENGPLTVREASQKYGEMRSLARTTVLTMMERLRSKGYLARTSSNGTNVYHALVGKTDLIKTAVRDFVDTTLKGSVAPFVSYLVEDSKLSKEELNELKRIIGELEGDE